MMRTPRRARFLPALLMAAALALPARAQQPDAAYQRFNAAKAQETEARGALERARAALQQAEAAAVAQADAELSARRQQAQRLGELDRRIVAAFDRLMAAGERPEKLLLELEVLQRWYDLYQPVVANLTERSFRPIEVELAALARQELIEAGERRLTSYSDLRARIVAVRTQLRERQEQSERQKAELRGELARLRQERDALLRDVARPSPNAQRAGESWLNAARELAAASQRRADAEAEVIRAYTELSAAAERQRPPLLVSVSAVAGPETSVYRGEWRAGEGESADERQRAERRRILRQRRQMVIEAMDELQAVRRAWTAGRLEAGERMAVRSRLLEQWTERYRDDLYLQWGVNVGFDIGLTLAELALTGGAATLERKSAEAVEKAVTAAGKAETSPLARALLQNYHLRGDAVSGHLRRAAQHVERDLADEMQQAANAMIRQGEYPRVAERKARELFQPAIDQIRQLEALRRAANRAAAQDQVLRAELEQFGAHIGRGLPDFNTAASALGQELGVEAATNLPMLLRLAQNPASGGAAADTEFSGLMDEFKVNSARDVAIGEAFEFGVTALINTYKDRPAAAAGEALGRWGRLRQFAGSVGEAQRKNARGYGLSVVSAAIKTWAASQTDALVNKDVEAIAELMGELSFLYRQYYIQLQMDRMLHDVLVALSLNYSAIQQALAEMDSGYTLTRSPEPAGTVPRDQTLRLELTFSAPLLAAPQVTLGGAVVNMRDAGDGVRWTGSIPVRNLGDGDHRLSVSLPAEASPFGSLDSDPSTGTVRRAGRWEGFERGADTHHRVRLALRAEDDAPLSDPRTFIGRWSGTGYTCRGAEPEQIVEITYSPWSGLEAKKLKGDDCIRAGEVTWRNGQLQGNQIQTELHVREPGASVFEEGSWVRGSLEVVSRDELRGFSITYRRIK